MGFQPESGLAACANLAAVTFDTPGIGSGGISSSAATSTNGVSYFLKHGVLKHPLTSRAARLNCTVLRNTGLGLSITSRTNCVPNQNDTRPDAPQRGGHAFGACGAGVLIEQN